MSSNNLLRMASIMSGVLILTQSFASGHQTRFIGDQTLISVEAPTISKAYYGRLSGAPAIYRIPPRDSYDLRVSLYIPCVAGADQDVVVEILLDGTPLATLDGVQYSDWKPFHEPFSGDDFVLGPEFQAQISSGEIEIRVHSPDNMGPYLLAVGEEEAWSLSELVHTLASLPSLKRSYFHKPVWTAYFNLLGLGLLIVTLALLPPIGVGIWIVRRRRAIDESRR